MPLHEQSCLVVNAPVILLFYCVSVHQFVEALVVASDRQYKREALDKSLTAYTPIKAIHIRKYEPTKY